MDRVVKIKMITHASLLIASAAVGSMWSFLASARALKLTSKRLINRNENQLSVRIIKILRTVGVLSCSPSHSSFYANHAVRTDRPITQTKIGRASCRERV